LIKEVSSTLDEMNKVNSHLVGIFKNKWAFVDSFIIICQNKKDGRKIMAKEFAIAFNEFENIGNLIQKFQVTSLKGVRHLMKTKDYMSILHLSQRMVILRQI